ncbi:hypothetical protein L207DRAFT_569865 [Hyaloscypha variabilis F]|uniref:Protein Zds1 C-terminal domain-containing protein n=1 Tax=Hyaloscypha variabilis (strain UAMH 11265 / GT02V1 / F) TaxID=1149755 RepID=A0A2J6R9V1_HYAVF|nr:hypothetical protein L207DRAFT_569865 [Hyaloscypha variabilis F]
MYGDDDDYSKRDSRPLSFVGSPLHESVDSEDAYFDTPLSKSPSIPLPRPSPYVNGSTGKKSHTSPAMLQSPRSTSFEKGQLSPSMSLRDRNVSDTANAQFPLNDIDYESDPTAIAQELNNLQALRRMSMDVGTSDPDLPSFQGVSLMPSVAPTGDDDEDDPSRLFWVPARVHPELAPMEFKTFLENRVNSIKRRSGEQASLSPDGLERSGSSSSLRRKKSMLSRQIDNDGGRGAIGYKDGADQLERKKSQSATQMPELKISDLKELDALVRDPSKAMQQLTLDPGARNFVGGEVSVEEDMPILPNAPGIGLRRSTRTTYRRGSLRKGERVPFSKRAGSLRGDKTEGEESPASSPVDGQPSIGFPLTKVQSEPASTENFSRPNRGGRRLQNLPQTSPVSSTESGQEENSVEATPSITTSHDSPQQPQPEPVQRSNSFPRKDAPVPRIIETPPPPEEPSESPPTRHQFPERSSSQTPPAPPARSNKRPPLDKKPSIPTPRVLNSSPTLNDMVQHPSPLPGSSARTDALTFIPTLEEKKPEKKSKKEKEDEASGSRKPSWGWFKGSDEKDKKDKKKEDDHKRSKAKLGLDKPHDNARLDVLQSTLETAPRGRESLVLDRDSMEYRLQDERKKESSRKSGGETKKEKDGLFSSFFGGSKKKSDRDSGGKKGSSLRALSPDPPHRPLKPDVDYNWTRFSILEERAIYRMAHIKLANPRRALYSQVLLSNFMYSYLAKVQQMHPQMQIPQSAAQKKQDAERRAREQEQQYRIVDEEELQPQQQSEGGDHYRYDYHQGIAQYAEPVQDPKQEGVNYVDDSQIYDYDHQGEGASNGQGSHHRPQSRASQHNSENGYHGRQGKEYYPYGRNDPPDQHEDEEDMW